MGLFFSTPVKDTSPAFVSFGMVVLDELQFPSRETLHDIPGGSGAYSTVGARIIASAAQSRTVGCIMMIGDDFPKRILDDFRSWDLSLEVRHVAGMKSTRGLLKYEDDAFGRKTFRYLTPPLQPLPDDLKDSPLLRSTAFHFLARPEDLFCQIRDLRSLREQCRLPEMPLLVWEPAPPFCKKSNHDAHIQACKHVDVFSPNHLELSSLFEEATDSDRPFDRCIIESYAKQVLTASAQEQAKSLALVIRAGEHGCLTLSRSEGCRWLPPYYDSASPEVVDPTGAGNTFLGAFTMVLQDKKDLTEAAMYGTVAASFALEQFGLPIQSTSNGKETWNHAEFACRLQQYRSRLNT